MVEPIRSNEVFGSASLTPLTAPTHVNPDHITCAYYVSTQEIAPTISVREFMECPHGFSGGGAWYNEDYIRQLNELSHKIIENFDLGFIANPRVTRELINELRRLTV